MDALQQHPQQSGAVLSEKIRRGVHTDRIEGSYRSITVHQLTLAWWLHSSGHMTRRQLRVYFALHEMAEKRRYGPADCRPLYTLDEIMKLVGGRGAGPRARSAITGDLSRLRRLGLANLSAHTIAFARSADEIRVDDLGGFWTMFEHIPNRRRTVPVPRRMLRALAAGFSKATTALVIAMLIRGLFWHKSSGDYRTDGRYKLSWVAEVFGISRRAVTDARHTLIELGWLQPLDVNQIMMNRYGLHDRIVTDWKRPDPAAAVGGQNRTKTHQASGRCSTGSACPSRDFSTESASPDLTGSLPLTGNQNTRKPAPTRAGPAGVSPTGSTGSRKEKSVRSRRALARGKPSIRDIKAGDLGDTDRLIELHRQACQIGLASASEHGRMTFFSLAERARSRGKRAGALFFWLLRERKTEFITQHDEDGAALRIRELMNGHRGQRTSWMQPEQQGGEQEHESVKPEHEQLTEQESFVAACLRVAQQRGITDPYIVVRQAKDWTRDEWQDELEAFNTAQQARWTAASKDPHAR